PVAFPAPWSCRRTGSASTSKLGAVNMNEKETAAKTRAQFLRDAFEGINGRQPTSDDELNQWLATDEGKAATIFDVCRLGASEGDPSPPISSMPSPRHFPPPWSAHKGTPRPAEDYMPGAARCFMRTNRTADEWADWCIAKNRMADELKEYYQACSTGELPPQLLNLSKKLDEELLKKQERSAVA